MNDYKKVKYFPLAPIAMEILISRGSAYKIVTKSGNNVGKKGQIFLLPKQLIELS
jgi:hypothetical protein